MEPIQVRLNRKMLDVIDRLVEEGHYTSRSEAIRAGVRRLCREHGILPCAELPADAKGPAFVKKAD